METPPKTSPRSEANPKVGARDDGVEYRGDADEPESRVAPVEALIRREPEKADGSAEELAGKGQGKKDGRGDGEKQRAEARLLCLARRGNGGTENHLPRNSHAFKLAQRESVIKHSAALIRWPIRPSRAFAPPWFATFRLDSAAA